MRPSIRNTLQLFLLALLLGSCVKDDDILPQDSFVRIFDDNTFSSEYDPIDLVQTQDGGYAILGAFNKSDSDFDGVYIMKVDHEGSFVSGQEVPGNLVNPVASLIAADNRIFFLSMDELTLESQLTEINENAGIQSQVSLGVTYPLAASIVQDEILVLSYNHEDKQTVLSSFDVAGTLNRQQEFDIGAGSSVEEPIVDHFTGSGRFLPFFVGRTSSGVYYFNGYYNYTFSLVFTDLNSGEPLGVSQGQQDEGGVSSALHLQEEKFAISKFNFGANYIAPNTSISTTSISSSINLVANPIPELLADSHVAVDRVLIGQQPYIVFAGTTKGGQILLMTYDSSQGSLLGINYLGFANPYRFSSFIQTADGGLAVLCVTQLAGRFPRICMFKVSNSELGSYIR